MDHQLTLEESLAVAAILGRGEIPLLANVHIEHRRGGALVDERIGHNLVVSAGKAGVAGLIVGSGAPTGGAFDAIGIGTGATAAAAGDTALQTEITTGGGARAAGSVSRVTTTVTNDTGQVTTTFTFSSSFAVTESGLFDQTTVSGSTLLARQVFSALNVVSGDTLSITWKIAVA